MVLVPVFLDGRSALDCMSTAAFLTKLREVAPELLRMLMTQGASGISKARAANKEARGPPICVL